MPVFAKLSLSLRAAVLNFTTEGLRNAWSFFHASRDITEMKFISPSDPRPKQLRTYIENCFNWEKSLKRGAIVC